MNTITWLSKSLNVAGLAEYGRATTSITLGGECTPLHGKPFGSQS